MRSGANPLNQPLKDEFCNSIMRVATLSSVLELDFRAFIPRKTIQKYLMEFFSKDEQNDARGGG